VTAHSLAGAQVSVNGQVIGVLEEGSIKFAPVEPINPPDEPMSASFSGTWSFKADHVDWLALSELALGPIHGAPAWLRERMAKAIAVGRTPGAHTYPGAMA
jgi:hypothetical protein